MRKLLEKMVGGLSTVLSSLATLGKCILMSRSVGKAGKVRNDNEQLIIMGNGPSLRDVLDNERGELGKGVLMAVNFAPNSNEFFELKPEYLVLADPHFFDGADRDVNVARLWERLRLVDWHLIMFVPVARISQVKELLGAGNDKNGKIIGVKGMNLTPAEGHTTLKHALYRRGLAMPRPRNVLIPAIMTGLREGYRDIRLVGADHSWSRSLWVDDQNRVISVQPHFYKDNEKEHERVAAEYAGYHLHDIYTSLSIAFRSYFDIADYAEKIGARILNCTPGSFIDAFPRGTLRDM